MRRNITTGRLFGWYVIESIRKKFEFLHESDFTKKVRINIIGNASICYFVLKMRISLIKPRIHSFYKKNLNHVINSQNQNTLSY